jgi:hypothetical protein
MPSTERFPFAVALATVAGHDGALLPYAAFPGVQARRGEDTGYLQLLACCLSDGFFRVDWFHVPRHVLRPGLDACKRSSNIVTMQELALATPSSREYPLRCTPLCRCFKSSP